MASRSKKKTTMAKLTRESRLRERRLEKQAKKVARKGASEHHVPEAGEAPAGDVDEPVGPHADQPDVRPVTQGVE
jgi:hypothetical protein